jgi:hypothetical protein
VVQWTDENGNSFQDEDTDYDGILDQRFQGDSQVEIPPDSAAPPTLPDLKCGRFNKFWRR